MRFTFVRTNTMPAKKVLVDMVRTRSLFNGQGQFCLKLGTELLRIQNPQVDLTFLLRNHECSLFPRHQRFERVRNIYRFNLPRIFKMLVRPFTFPYDVWHVTAQDVNFWPVWPTTRVILTIHDLNFLIEKKSAKRRARRLRLLQRRVDRAACITTISEFSAAQIRENLNLGSKPVHVIYNGANEYNNAKSEVSNPPIEVTPGQFLFTIGVLKAKKNFHVLLPLMRQLAGVKLVIAGDDKGDYAEQIKQQITELQLEGKVLVVGKVSDPERNWLYSNCLAFMFPSLAEGFGLPVIEAMSFGKPVFVSDQTSLPEVAGDCGFYFRSFTPGDMLRVYEQGMTAFRRDPSFPTRLQARADGFSWSKAAQQYMRLYESV